MRLPGWSDFGQVRRELVRCSALTHGRRARCRAAPARMRESPPQAPFDDHAEFIFGEDTEGRQHFLSVAAARALDHSHPELDVAEEALQPEFLRPRVGTLALVAPLVGVELREVVAPQEIP